MKLILGFFIMFATTECALAGSLTDDPESVSKALESFNSHSTSWAQPVKDHFQTLSCAADTKQAHALYRFLGALLMTGETKAITLHDAIVDSFYRRDNTLLSKIGLCWGDDTLNPSDKHILTARFKVASVINVSLPTSMQAFQTIWEPHQKSLWASLTQQEKDGVNLSSTVGQVVRNVLIPDTLLMGMDPFQQSVFAQRPEIFFNPRVQFVDIRAPSSYESFLEKTAANYSPEVVRDLLYRTFCADYSDELIYGKYACLRKRVPWKKEVNKSVTSMINFIQERREQYNRIIFDHSSLCGVNQSFLVLQLLLRKNSFIYTQTDDAYNTINVPEVVSNVRRIPDVEIDVPGNMLPEDFNVENLEGNDAWFVRLSMHSSCEKRGNLKRYQRKDTISEPPAPPLVRMLTAEEGRALLTEEEYVAQIEKAKIKLAELQDEGRVLDALVGVKVNRLLAEMILKEAKEQLIP